MIDTIKIYTQISKELYHKISYLQNVSQKFNESTGEIFYKVSSDDLKGSYDSNVHVGVGVGSKYNFIDSYYIEIECSPHKVFKGQNAYDGFYDLKYISILVINLVETEYQVKLPKLEFWYCSRVDINKNFDIHTQNNVNKYIDSLKLLSFPRRENKKGIYKNGLYFPGTYTTVKIYNKLDDFEVHDKKRLLKFKNSFNVFEHELKIQGFIRFEVEIKSRKLKNIYGKNKIFIVDINYDDLVKVWSDEFMKLLKFEDLKDKNINKRVRTKDDVLTRLKTIYPDNLKKVNLLYSFFILILNDGYEKVKENNSKTTFYRNVSLLKEAGIDFNQCDFSDIAIPNTDNLIDFDPFTYQEVI